MPDNKCNLEIVANDFDQNGLPGCCGYIDVVYRDWEKCASEFTLLFKGKEGFPTVAFQIIVTHRNKILNVSLGYPGVWNDKHIVKVESIIKSLHSGSHWLRSRKWYSKKPYDSVIQHRSYWLLVGGSYLRWASLICPIKYDVSKKKAQPCKTY